MLAIELVRVVSGTTGGSPVQGDKCPITLRGPAEADNPLQDVVEVMLGPLHHTWGFS